MSHDVDISERHRRESAHFDQKAKAKASLQKIKLDQFSQAEYGPWNIYWYIYDLVRRTYHDPSQRLLSFGCGRGANALRYAQLGYEVFGFDISPSSIATAKSLADHYQLQSRTHFSVQGAEQLAFPDNHFDVVAGENILHHVDIGRAIAEAARVAKPGGLIIFKEPLATAGRDRLRQTALIRWLVPTGVKNIHRGLKYNHPPDTVKLTDEHLDIFRRTLVDVEIVPFRVLAVFNVFARSRTFLEKADHALFKIVPPARRLGDMAVMIGRKRAG